MKATPGPWSYVGEEDGDFCVFGGRDDAYVCNVGKYPIIPILENPKLELVAFDTTLANARLIAACPDYHAAAQSMADHNGGPIDGIDGIEYVMVRRVDFDAMVAAMAKAEGEGND